MRNGWGPAAVIGLAVLAMAPAAAHHSIAKFDGRRVVKVSGVVTGFRWINPHASIELQGSGAEGGDSTHWVVEMQAPTTLMADGWQRDSLVAGDRVTVFANPLRDAAAGPAGQRGLYVGIILPGGLTLGRVDEPVVEGDK